MDRGNHYEAAFEAYLQEQRLCYMAVNERRRSVYRQQPIKNLDFVVYSDSDARLLIDVKGRRFPMAGSRKVWESWATQEDVDGLLGWLERFGPGYEALLLFMYHLVPPVEMAADTPDLWEWRGRNYLLRAVRVEDYREHMRVRSPKWRTVSLPGTAFRELVRPFRHFLDLAQPVGG
jgi:hypothetical protein